jgi:hypothetical protein
MYLHGYLYCDDLESYLTKEHFKIWENAKKELSKSESNSSSDDENSNCSIEWAQQLWKKLVDSGQIDERIYFSEPTPEGPIPVEVSEEEMKRIEEMRRLEKEKQLKLKLEREREELKKKREVLKKMKQNHKHFDKSKTKLKNKK